MKRKFIIIALLLIYSLKPFAEDVISVKPFKTTAGVAETEYKYIEIVMENSTFDVANLQFDLKLPEGIHLTEITGFTTRVPSTANPFTGTATYDFSVQSALQTSGYTRYVFVPGGQLRAIPKGSGSILMIIYTTDASMEAGVYPISLTNIELDKSVTESIKIDEVTSYMYIGETNPLSNDAHVDLSGMTGYVPSFVVEQLNSDIAGNTNLRSLNLSGTTLSNLGAALSVPNNDNLLWYTSDKASLNRTFKGEQWNTVCLPFTLQTSYLNASTVVKEMADYDGEATITLGDVTTMETGKPYLIYSSTDGQLIKDVTISNPVAVSNEPSTTSSNSLTMRGTYQEATVKSDGGYTRYGFTNGKFVMLGTGAATVPPFRAYLEYLGKSSTRSINIAGDGTTGINSTISDDESNGPLYDLRGVMMNEGQQNKGIFVRNGKKQILK